jgi:hypothetical protein
MFYISERTEYKCTQQLGQLQNYILIAKIKNP